LTVSIRLAPDRNDIASNKDENGKPAKFLVKAVIAVSYFKEGLCHFAWDR